MIDIHEKRNNGTMKRKEEKSTHIHFFELGDASGREAASKHEKQENRVEQSLGINRGT